MSLFFGPYQDKVELLHRIRGSRSPWPSKLWYVSPGSTQSLQDSLTEALLKSQRLSTTPQIPFKIHHVPTNRDHKALNRGTWGGLGSCFGLRSKWSCIGPVEALRMTVGSSQVPTATRARAETASCPSSPLA